MQRKLKYISSLFLTVASLLMAAQLHANSLWMRHTNNERGMFAERIAANVGDILTITINENTTQETKLSSENKKNATILGKVVSYLFPSSGFGKHNDEFPSTNISLSNDDYKGEGTIKNSSKLIATASVTIVDKLSNGNLVIHGKRSVAYSKEKEFAVITGIVRQIDIRPDNTIDSTKIANAQVHFEREGEIANAQKKGWLLKIKDFVNPF